MRIVRKLCSIATGLAVATSLLVSATVVSAKQVGIATAVNPDARGTPPQAPTRMITVGLGMIRDELVETGPVGRTQLLFLDGSALTIGPSSELVLDTFVYNPDEKSGELAVSVTKGLFRYVGGKISKKTPVRIQTPHATIGIRGGICLVLVTAEATRVTLLFGILTVTSGGETKTLERSGFELTIDDPAAKPGKAVRADEVFLANALIELEGVTGSTGGVPVPPTDDDVAASAVPVVSSTISADEVSTQTSFPPVQDTVPTSPAGSDTGGLKTSDDAAQLAAIDQANEVDTDPARVDLVEAVQTAATNSATATAPILTSSLVGRIKLALTPSTKGTDEIAGTNYGFSFGTVNALPGLLNNNTSPSFIIDADTGTFAATSSTNPFGSTFSGNGTLTADGEFLYYLDLIDGSFDQVLAWAGVPTPATAMPTSGLTYYSFLTDQMLNSDVVFVPDSTTGTSSVAVIDWGNQNFLSSNVVISGTGSTQDSYASVMTGEITNQTDPNLAAVDGEFRGTADRGTKTFDLYAGGVDTQRAADGTDGDSFSTGIAFYGSSHPDYFVLGSLGSNDEIVANTTTTYNPNSIATSSSTSASATRTTQTLSAYTAGVVQEFSAGGPLLATYMFQDEDVAAGGNTGGTSTVTTNAGTGAITATFDTHDLEDELDVDFDIEFGGDGDPTRHAFIDDKNFASIEKTGGVNTVLAYAIVDDALYFTTAGDGFQYLPGGVTFCACDYLSWGFWGGTVEDGSGARAVMHLGTWVAGDNSALTIPTSGMATYNGHIIGTVNNAGSLYLAAGDYQQTVSFGAGTHASTVNVTSFDSVNYATAAPAVNAGSTFSANLLPSDASTKVMTIDGSFFAGGGDDTAAVGGNFQIKNAGTIAGSTYTATGIFAAEK